jgi:hypothetical protein
MPAHLNLQRRQKADLSLRVLFSFERTDSVRAAYFKRVLSMRWSGISALHDSC